jgi:hypothetical protein
MLNSARRTCWVHEDRGADGPAAAGAGRTGAQLGTGVGARRGHVHPYTGRGWALVLASAPDHLGELVTPEYDGLPVGFAARAGFRSLQVPTVISVPAPWNCRTWRPDQADEERAGQVGVDEDRAGEVGAVEVRAGEVGADEPRAGQVGAVEPRAGQVGAVERRAGEDRVEEARAGQVGAYEVRAAEVRAAEVRAGEVRAGEVGAAQPRADQMETAQVDCLSFWAVRPVPSAVRAAWISGVGSEGRSGVEPVTGCIHT